MPSNTGIVVVAMQINDYSISKILVAVDMSETSLNALDTAVSLAKKHHALVQILNVSEPVFDQAESPAIQYNRQANSDVLKALTGAVHHMDDVESVLIQKKGNVVESIITTSQNERSDLIIMGSHGASGYREGFIGTNTYNVIKHSSVAVLTIPPKRKFTSFRKILFPIRPVANSLEQYDVVCAFSSTDHTMDVLGLSYLKLNRETAMLDKIVSGISEKLVKNNATVKTSWGTGVNISDDILQYAYLKNPELIVVTPMLDAISKPNFIGPYTQKVINHSKSPLLVLKKAGSLVYS